MSEMTFEELEQQPIILDSESDADHASLLTEGFNDSFNGSESVNLTYAQKYLNGVLYANDIIRHDLAGMESAWETVKTGIAKTWKVVKEAIKKLWDWVFGDAPKKLDAEIKEAIEINFPKIKALPNFSELNTDRLNAIRDMAKTYKESGVKISESFQSAQSSFNKIESYAPPEGKAALASMKKDIEFIMRGFKDDSGIQKAVDHASSKSSIENLKSMYDQARKHEETIIQTLRGSKKEGDDIVKTIEDALSAKEVPLERRPHVNYILTLAKQFVKVTGEAVKAYERRMRTLAKLVHMTSDKLFEVNGKQA